jgi:hypothetical protein
MDDETPEEQRARVLRTVAAGVANVTREQVAECDDIMRRLRELCEERGVLLVETDGEVN